MLSTLKSIRCFTNKSVSSHKVTLTLLAANTFTELIKLANYPVNSFCSNVLSNFSHTDIISFGMNSLCTLLMGSALEKEMGSRKYLYLILLNLLTVSLWTYFSNPKQNYHSQGNGYLLRSMLYYYALAHPKEKVFLYFAIPV